MSPPDSTSQALQWCGSINLQQAHSILAEICTIYLDFRDFEGQVLPKPEKRRRLDDHIFFEYSARNWAAHLRYAGIEDRESIVSTILKLCDPDMKRFNTWFTTYWEAVHYESTPEFTALMVVSHLGFQGAAILLLDRGAEPNLQNNYGWTALHLAAKNGHEAVAKQLLDKGADASLQDNNGGTALHWAAGNGHEAVVEILQS